MSDDMTREMDAIGPDDIQVGSGAAQARPAGGLSRLSELAQKYRATEAMQTGDFEVPGFGGELKVRYRVPEFERVREIEQVAVRDAARGGDHPYAEIRVMIAELLHSCECLLVRNVETSEYEPMQHVDTGALVKLGDPAVKDMLDLQYADEASDVVLGLFAYANGRNRAPFLIQDHYAEWLAWLRDARRGAVGRFAGE